jgi:hypothetical protein
MYVFPIVHPPLFLSFQISLHTQRRDKQRWQGAWKRQYVKERILIWVRCICFWHARSLRICTRLPDSWTETNTHIRADRTRKIGWKLQSNQGTTLRPYPRTMRGCIPKVIDRSYIVKCSTDSAKCTAGSCTGTTGHCQQYRTRKGHGPTFDLNIMDWWTGFCSNKSVQRF